jgi:hypothetical protein
MTTRKQNPATATPANAIPTEPTPAPYTVGYGKPPTHTQFRKGQSGNPAGRPRRTAAERAKALVLKEAYRSVKVKEGDRVYALPALQAVLRSQVALAAKGNAPAQRAVIAAVQAIEQENVAAARTALRRRYAMTMCSDPCRLAPMPGRDDAGDIAVHSLFGGKTSVLGAGEFPVVRRPGNRPQRLDETPRNGRASGQMGPNAPRIPRIR